MLKVNFQVTTFLYRSLFQSTGLLIDLYKFSEFIKFKRIRRPQIYRRCVKCNLSFTSESAYSVHMDDHSFVVPELKGAVLFDYYSRTSSNSNLMYR